MVMREVDKVTLYFIGADGQKVSVTPNDSQAYSAVVATADAQISAKRENFHALNLYNNKIMQMQISVDASRNPGPKPDDPVMLVVVDPTIDENGVVTQGVESEEDFPDAVLMHLVPKV